MTIPIYQIDAFASKLFEGNPAAVCPLPRWLPDDLLQAIAAENNLSETAYFVPRSDGYHIRWFTPASEVDLCGHATLASAFVIFHFLQELSSTIQFESRSGQLTVTRDGDWLVMNFPAQPPTPCDQPQALAQGLGQTPGACLQSEDYIAVFDSETDIKALQPDFEALKRLDRRGVIVTAPSAQYDFVARFFAPKLAVPEDPVTGSAYTQLAPYWAERLGPKRFHVRQLSARGGELMCEVVNERVFIYGKAVPYLQGRIDIPD
ncbi:MAG: PhzF family phenazine biosynthesis protein [candidate division KSB1 bacterium]|nr:PhzF family phenazine biosynthesis protein [candidate division KSB1 bacterium]